MTLREILSALNPMLPDSQLSIEAELMLDEDVLFRLLFTTKEAAFVLFSFQVYINKKLLAEKVNAIQALVKPQ